MPKLTAEDVAKMTATDRLDRIATLSPEMAKIVADARADGMSDLQLLEHFQSARNLKPN